MVDRETRPWRAQFWRNVWSAAIQVQAMPTCVYKSLSKSQCRAVPLQDACDACASHKGGHARAA